MNDERKAVKYHDRLVAALRGLKLEEALEFEGRLDAHAFFSCDALHEAQELLAEIEREP